MQQFFDGAIPVVAVVREYLQQVDETKPRHSMEAKPVTLDAIKPHRNTSVDPRQLAAADVGLELVWDPHLKRFGTSMATSVRTTYRTHSQCRRFVACQLDALCSPTRMIGWSEVVVRGITMFWLSGTRPKMAQLR